jgi:hypothetical protein
MKARLIALFLMVAAAAAGAAKTPVNFAGKWTFDAAQSKNVGMMATMTIHTTVTQTPAEVIVDDASILNGQTDTQHTVYRLTGEAIKNTPLMGGTATTVSHWDGGRLITEWDSPGAIAGTTVKRIETRYLSPDGATMIVESAREGRDALVMVYTRDR